MKLLLTLWLVMGLGLAPTVEAGWLGKALTRSAMKKLLRREAVRDAATLARPLAGPRTVFRYTSSERAAIEAREGLTAGRHMTSMGGAGRPLSADAAQRRYGLMDKPEIRETIHLPQGVPARHNRVLRGEAGVGEITSPENVPPGAISKVVRLK